ncbi:cold-inducible protein YdjO-related protein [Paenibacillus thalictri]|uniref:Cold-shock protein n=1 Tax=Paenibacillus thalictri TaxID=2527873 RepID=A0A4Q9DIT0_9BACL|nr:cold-inducible protein YdjO-related protein [Paenibacillus thalictri]TBL70724.1 hypothetical protein EYB31_32380 [Paenibacillus thalictri]
MATITTEEQSHEMKHVQIWKCKEPECKAWVREEFVTEENPSCPLCKGQMIRSYKHLPETPKKGKKKFLIGRKR